jgi:acyl-CoA thioester hydrolase
MDKNSKNKLAYTHTQKVKSNEIDDLNHVNNVVYLQWINDVSILHWNAMATKEIKQKYIWVAIRHEIDYLQPAFLNETINIKTWIETLKGVKSIRHVEIYRDKTLLAKSKTTWCLLDAKTNKITRVTKEMEELFESS